MICGLRVKKKFQYFFIVGIFIVLWLIKLTAKLSAYGCLQDGCWVVSLASTQGLWYQALAAQMLVHLRIDQNKIIRTLLY